MKKLLLLITAIICSVPAFSQEADSDSQAAGFTELQLIARADATPVVPRNGAGTSDFTFGGSAIYTVISANLGKGFSVYFNNHWFSIHPEELYKNTGYSNRNSWVDFAYLSYSNSSWSFKLGKNSLPMATYENSPWDWETHAIFNSFVWYAIPCYQYGISAKYTTDSKRSSFEAQFACSPFTENIFRKNSFTYSFRWCGQYGIWKPMASAHMMNGEFTNKFVGMLMFANRFEFEKFNVTLDWTNMSDTNKHPFRRTQIDLVLDYNIAERCNIALKGGYESNGDGPDLLGWGDGLDYHYMPQSVEDNYIFGALQFIILPLKNNENLNIHFTAGINNVSDNMAMNIGVTYILDFLKL